MHALSLAFFLLHSQVRSSLQLATVQHQDGEFIKAEPVIALRAVSTIKLGEELVDLPVCHFEPKGFKVSVLDQELGFGDVPTVVPVVGVEHEPQLLIPNWDSTRVPEWVTGTGNIKQTLGRLRY